MARHFSIYEAKAKLSELLRTVKRGNEVIVTERGNPIAKVIPFHPATSLTSRLEELEARGNLVRSSSEGKFPKGIQVTGTLKRFLASRD